MALTPKGYWNALTNEPHLVDGSGAIGDFYIVSIGYTNRDLGSGPKSFVANMGVMYSTSGAWLPMPVLLTLDINDFLGSSPGSGTVTSVGLSTPSIFTPSGTPVTTSGTLGFSWNGISAGDILYASGVNTITRLGIGSTGQVLTVSGSTPSWMNTSGSTGTVTSISTTGPITGGPIISSGTIGITQATSGTSGYISASDYSLFYSKGTGTVTSIVTISPLTGGTITGSGTLGIQQSTSGTSGYLSASDWTLFNSKGLGTVTSVSGTTNRITSTGGAAPSIDISSTFEALLGKVASPLSQFAATTSAQLASTISDETGSGSLVFANVPSLVSPILGTPTSATLSSSGVTLGPVTVAVGSDATGDLHYRNSSGLLARLGIGSVGNVLSVSGGLPVWASPVYTGMVESISFNDIGTSIGNNTYTIDLYAEYPYTINELKIISGSGTCTAAIQINGISVTGISAVSVSTSIATGTASALNSVAASNKVTLVLSATSSLNNLQVTIKTTRL